MVALTPISRTQPGFYVSVVAAFGAFFGVFIGTGHGSMIAGVIGGAVLMGLAALALTKVVKNERAGRWGLLILVAIAGYAVAGFPGLFIGTVLGWFFGFMTFWLYEGRYRAKVAPYLTPGQVLWHFTFRTLCGAIFFFLIAPIIIVMPLSFNAENFFTFTPEMLRFDPAGYSLKHYRDFFTNDAWQDAVKNSLRIAPVATLLSVGFGTLAAIGLSQPHVPFRRAIMAVLISPMIVPLIISAAGMYFFYSRVGLQGTYIGVVLAHAALGIPFVIITVTATLVGFDNSLTRAAANMGANPVTTFFRVQMPLILPGVISGGLFAFITSFDEVVVVLFVGSAGQKTLPWQMFIGLREQISPTILAVATILVFISICLLTVVELLRRRSERMRGMSPS
ncbi:ABC transporter permease [Sulfitobacter guttiformis]|uniref:Putative spermidine/putrescine transport system permease protein n=1 Tax=Sulfitobacter guttiformis TaxID=74349 RepID=A0A420DSK3_9RHOB|nr:ABC transporter permease [Sulfitobacter guttiformis]KIN74530.1 Spermidine/putrescine transport system permease protein PotC [Sulfitobacter guttiformis KCTC 32187]RKE97117.1 putative spermidine/putrescine transport system permease protein [Sulfitobacter guttiformis]